MTHAIITIQNIPWNEELSDLLRDFSFANGENSDVIVDASMIAELPFYQEVLEEAGFNIFIAKMKDLWESKIQFVLIQWEGA